MSTLAIRASRDRNRYSSFTYPQYDSGAALDGGILSLSKIGRIRMWLHRPLHRTSQTVTLSREADRWYARFSCAEVPVQLVPHTGHETGRDVDLKAFRVIAEAGSVENPDRYRRAEKRPAAALWR